MSTPDTGDQPVAVDRRADETPDWMARVLRRLPDPAGGRPISKRGSAEDYARVFGGSGQNGHNRFNELRRRGVPKFNAAVAAGSPTGFSLMSGHPAVQQALPNRSFYSIGLPLLRCPGPSLTRSNRRGT